MRFPLWSILGGVLGMLLFGCGTASSFTSLPLSPHVPGNVAVMLHTPGPATMHVGAVTLKQVGRAGMIYRLATPTNDAALPALLGTLRADPRVAAADVDLVMPKPLRAITLNDPQAASEYWIDAVNLRPVWEKGAFGAVV